MPPHYKFSNRGKGRTRKVFIGLENQSGELNISRIVLCGTIILFTFAIILGGYLGASLAILGVISLLLYLFTILPDEKQEELFKKMEDTIFGEDEQDDEEIEN